MSFCPECKREVGPGATVIGPWHAGCAPPDVIEAWGEAYRRGMEAGAVMIIEMINNPPRSGPKDWTQGWIDACTVLHGQLVERVAVLKNGDRGGRAAPADANAPGG